jgi:hypothetical protein
VPGPQSRHRAPVHRFDDASGAGRLP